MPTEKCGVWSGTVGARVARLSWEGEWLRGAEVLVFEAGSGKGGRTGGGPLSRQGSTGPGGSLDEAMGAYIPCLGSQRLLVTLQ